MICRLPWQSVVNPRCYGIVRLLATPPPLPITLPPPPLSQRAVAEGLTFVAPYDDPYTIAGQGTIGDEILRQARGRAPQRRYA